jgi:hypothetical protein
MHYPLANVYLTWRREGDGVLVYEGSRPCNPRLPVGQDIWEPGFNITDWMYNSRPQRPVEADAP